MMRKSGGAAASSKRTASSGIGAGSSKQMPTLQDFLATRDFTGKRVFESPSREYVSSTPAKRAGAITLLEFQRRTDTMDVNTLPWLAFCAFHLGDYHRALEVYTELSATRTATPDVALNRACCMFYLQVQRSRGAAVERMRHPSPLVQEFKEAEALAAAAAEHPLRTRLLFHLSHKLSKEQALVQLHTKLRSDSKFDQLTLAAMQVWGGWGGWAGPVGWEESNCPKDCIFLARGPWPHREVALRRTVPGLPLPLLPSHCCCCCSTCGATTRRRRTSTRSSSSRTATTSRSTPTSPCATTSSTTTRCGG